MKNSKKRVIALVLTFALVFSAASVGIAVTASKFISSAPAATLTSQDGSAVIDVNSVDEAVEVMKNSPELFSEPEVAEIEKQQSPSPEAAPRAVAETTAERIYPTIILPGISQSVSYLANEDGTPALNADGDELTGGLLIIDQSTLVPVLTKTLLTPLLSSLIRQKNVGLDKAVYSTVQQLFSIQTSDKSGNAVNNLKTISFIDEDGVPVSVAEMTEEDRSDFYRMIPMQSIREQVGEENLYLFTFPLIGDPMQSARELHDYIEGVKEARGVDKVNIATISLGGTILTAYLEEYKDDPAAYEQINRVINVVACLQGTDIMGDFYSRGFDNFRLDDEFLYHEYVPMIFKESEGYTTYGHLINVALRIFPKNVVYTILTAAADGIMDTLMLNCPQFWAMVPTDRYDSIIAKYDYIATDPEYAELYAKISKFHTAAVNLKDNLLKLNAGGVYVDSICGYNLDYTKYDYNFFGIMKSSLTTNSDGIIDIDSTSLGATYAPAGEVLPYDYVPAKEGYISDEGSIDASTCLFPDNVWFFNGQHHEVGRNDVVIKLVGQLVTGEIKTVADKADKYPQFNGTRNTKNIFRWYFDEAEAILQPEVRSVYTRQASDIEGINYEPKVDISTLSSEDIAELQAAYDEALLLLDDTVCDTTAAEATSERLLNALRRVGVRGEEADPTTDLALEKIATFVDDAVYKVFGGNGFSDGILKK